MAKHASNSPGLRVVLGEHYPVGNGMGGVNQWLMFLYLDNGHARMSCFVTSKLMLLPPILGERLEECHRGERDRISSRLPAQRRARHGARSQHPKIMLEPKSRTGRVTD